MVPDSRDAGLGAWSNADFRATALQNAGIGVDADLPPAVRFVSGVAKLVRRRMAQHEAKADPVRLAIFLLEPNAQSHKPNLKPKRIPMLDTALTVLSGRLWFVSPAVSSGKYVDLENLDDDALFSIVTDDLQLGDVPAIIFDPRPRIPLARFYPRGLNELDGVVALDVANADVTFDRIFAAIDLVYRQCLITPELQEPGANLWNNNLKWWPVHHAEHLLQQVLRAGLATSFPTCNIRFEQTLATGRFDILIEESQASDRSQVTMHAILELKVLRSFGKSGSKVSIRKTNEWIESGVRQAASYRKERAARLCALCCFDMRQEYTAEKCFDHVRQLATDLAVALRVWFIHATSEHYRRLLTTI